MTPSDAVTVPPPVHVTGTRDQLDPLADKDLRPVQSSRRPVRMWVRPSIGGLPVARTASARVAAVALVALTLVGCGASAAEVRTLSADPARSKSSATVRVLEAWQGPELESFMEMVRPFEEQTGARVVVTSTRDLVAETRRAIAAGDPPDLVGLPSPLEMRRLADDGYLLDLSGVVDVDSYKADNPPAVVGLGTVDDRLVGVFVKAAVKGLVWFDPKVHRLAIPDTWDELVGADHGQTATTKLWCAGFESRATSGWPGTDWVEDILLRQSGPDAYDAWVAGRLPWSSAEVRRAFRTFGVVVAPSNVTGGVAGVADTSFEAAGDPLFTTPPGCLFLHQGSFMPAFFPPGKVVGHDYDFFPFPTINPRYARAVIGGGDIFGMLRDTPQARDLLRYLVTPEAQSILVGRGGALSTNAQVHYPNDVTRRMADVLIGADLFRFDASDLMPEPMSAAFDRAVIDFTRDQSRLAETLESLDQVAADAYRR